MSDAKSNVTTSPKKKRGFSFRSSKASRESATIAANPERAKKKKKQPFRRIRGVLTGESRRERRAKRKAAREAARARGIEVESISSASDLGDADSLYGVNLDSVQGSPTRSLLSPHVDENDEEEEFNFMSPADKLKVVLLLMDPGTRRFELLQLQFDSNKAIVSDVLTEIPLSVTEGVFRQQTYIGVCDRSGLELIKSLRLSGFVSGNDILIAIPKGMDATRCAKLAKPILADIDVSNMLQANGVITTAETPKFGLSRDFSLKVATNDRSSHHYAVRMGKVISIAAVLCLLTAVLLGFHIAISAPLLPGHSMSPGSWRSKCGILSPFPPLCKNVVLSMGRDGVLSLTGPDRESVEWKIVGSVCRTSDANCADGVAVKENGRLEIAGKSVKAVTVKGDAPLTPWPFAEDPKLRVIRAKK